MRPTDALAAHRRTTEEIKLSLEDMLMRNDPPPPPKPWKPNNRYGWAEHLLQLLRLSSTYFVTSDMMALLDASWPSIPDGQLSEEQDPGDCGYLIYDRPIVGTVSFSDSVGEDRIHGYMWAKMDEQVVAYPLGIIPGDIDWYHPIGSIWNVGRHSSEKTAQNLKPLRATWAFMRQKLAVSTSEPADRAERRRCARLDLPQEVNVVRVRKHERVKDDNPGQRDVEWSHRWLVAGHWRQQYLPSTGERRPTWISSHIKGPEDKPLVVKDRVTAWVR